MTSRRLSFSMPHRGSRKSQAMDDAISELKQIYDSIRYDWPQILDHRANAIETAISLLDDSSVGLAHRLPEFENLKQQTEVGLRNVVNEHHEIFNNSIGSYHMLLSTLRESQEDSTEIKAYLESSNKEIHDRSDLLSELSQTSARYSELIDVLDAMAELTSIPDKIEQLVIDKKIHEVYDVISNGYKTAEKYNLWSLPAMAGIQSYLESQSNKLFDMIIDELQNEIYLKQTRITTDTTANISWQSIFNSSAPQLASLVSLINSKNLEQYVSNAANLDITEIVDFLTQPVQKFILHQLPELHTHSIMSDKGTEVKDDYQFLLDTKMNSNSSSFYYIYMLLRTASKLSRLHQVTEILIDSNQSELHGLINRTTEEIKSKNSTALSKLTNIKHHSEKSTLLEIMGNSNFNDSAVVVLEELFGSIFVKCLAVFHRHKVVNEIVRIIEEGQNLTSNTSMLSIWNVIKKELRTMMLNYIYDDSLVHANIINEPTTRAKDQSKIYKVITSRKNLFRFEDVTYDTSSRTATEILGIVTDVFPGFNMSGDNKELEKTKDELLGSSASPYIQTEQFNAMIDVLVPKNLFNMRVILEFFLIFIEGSQRVFANFEHSSDVTPHSKSSLQFFNDFMKISFMGYVKDGIEISFGEQVGGTFTREKPLHSTGLKLDLISLNQASDINVIANVKSDSTHNVIIYENAFNFKKLYLELCLMFNTSLTYRQDYSDVVLKVLDNFAREYHNLYHELLSAGDSTANNNRPVSQTSKWMNIPALREISMKILQAHVQNVPRSRMEELFHAESQVLLFEGNDDLNAVEKDDLLDPDSYSQVLYLLLTTSWVLSWLPLIKKETNTKNKDESDSDTDLHIAMIDKLRSNWSFLENGRMPINFTANSSDIIHHNVFLCLGPDKVSKFDQIVKTFETIRDGTLLALRYDLRCKAIYYTTNSYKHVDWTPTNEPGDADHYIGLFNQEVFAVDSKLSSMLSNVERETVFIGLTKFLNDLFIQGSINLKKVNNNGIKRILLNISTVQQMLRSVATNPEVIDFTKSSVYFEMFTLNEFTLINRFRSNEQRYTKSACNNLARLIYSEKLADGQGSSFNKGKYNDLLKKIDELVD
ncbi:uncharacterized protein SPAPADRAFT_157214 [Spathaspora passalidarum NRRL Y-27907]|uniref:Exocyst complex component Sec8 n=1 Tax=Spathaspora passalidarum (strain NRRL Y-27907 / 11-Y1) TaxID=619300 RepID=G3ATV8_SPAPN|nr:uncharacterized protein SPAPADRAFT_157214 [Spathaspora passalidarum NRRL Y-27907]EGW30333.1 hypothetical protein SPAPADRAFT_157214 [Spathaspora passalidarum NRRL Y-27907]